jgi:N-acetylglucosaminyldiphosphoundecaprenol N-acetyl-beta-D-mannosaminyltransferase
MNDKVRILQTDVSRYNLTETMEQMSSAIEEGKKLRIAVTPVNCLLWARKNRELNAVYNSADIVTADGVPVVWASRLLSEPIRGRVTGLDLLPAFSEISARKNYSFFFLGAAEGVAEKLADKLRSTYPGLQIAGTWSPPFRERFSGEENREMVERINQSGADVLWVSLTAPKQDLWIASHFDQLNVSVAIGVGAAFDVVAGNISRAPLWMQQNGLEWFYRLIKEPGRLSKRYLVEAPVFIPLIFKQLLTSSKKEKQHEKK